MSEKLIIKLNCTECDFTGEGTECSLTVVDLGGVELDKPEYCPFGLNAKWIEENRVVKP